VSENGSVLEITAALARKLQNLQAVKNMILSEVQRALSHN